jgi:hypothetical protein
MERMILHADMRLLSQEVLKFLWGFANSDFRLYETSGPTMQAQWLANWSLLVTKAHKIMQNVNIKMILED